MDALAGKVAVITGGASGIGQAVAERAAAEGMKIVLADIEKDALNETARLLSNNGAEVLAVVTDVSDAASVEALRDRALDRFGVVHLLHNNAGVGGGGLAWTVTEADWKWILGVNLWGVIHGIRAFVPVMLAQGEGHVVNTASMAGMLSPQLMAPYCVTKHSVVTLSECLYRDLRLVGSNVGVSVLCPGFVRTGISESERNRPVWAPAPEADAVTEGLRAAVGQLVADGINPSVVADHVLDAVRANHFYIFTHPEMKAAIELRMGDVLEERAPSELQLEPVSAK
jgi:NAD(P)-dependent dehydrogenase (short-subunit alcohol dehydrogenase family)